ncbi:SprB repeat-containing protein [Maribacter halichondriae]|uniref:SprB repeat-containing protein n=1 Tax=Maribacter halichondriae TaxID=2980554 RepID=UPI0023591012|nr:SprB repeat-containing protein [Maribacter sp. Hal144]
MENTTHYPTGTLPIADNSYLELQKKNFKKSSRMSKMGVFLFFVGLMALPLFGIAQQQQDLRPLNLNCTANDVQLLSAELSGTGCTTCMPGDVLTYDLLITVLHNTNSNRPALAVMGDLTTTDVNGVPTVTTFAECSGPIIPKNSILDNVPVQNQGNGIQVINFGQVTYTCGSSLELSNIMVAWTVPSDDPCPILSGDVNSSKCDRPTGTLIINPPLQAMATAACSSGNNVDIDLDVMGGTAPYNYSWSNGATTEDLFSVAPGNYSVTVTDADGCTIPASITVGPALTATATTTDVLCFGDATGAIDLSVSGGVTPYAYAWSTADGSGLSVSDEDQTGLSPGTYEVMITDDKGCTITESFTINEPVELAAPIVTVVDATCEMAGSASLVPVAGLTYTVSPSGAVDVDGNITGLTPGTDYTVTAENASGCTADSEVFTIGATLDAVDAPVVTVVDATCEMAGSASLVPVAGLTYTVSPSGAVDVDGNITGLTPGTDYTVTAENASGCTADSEVFTIGATLDAVDAPVVTVVDATCEMAGSASLVPVAGLTYTVSPSGAVDVDGNITGLTPGTDYTVTAENASGCTADSEVFTIGATLDAVDAPVVTVVDATCEMAGSASLVPVAGLTYTVSPSGAVDVDGNITGLTPGTDYTVTAENASGCTADSEVFTIGATLDAVDAPVVTVVDATCEMAGSASLVPVAGLTYTVSPSGAVDVDGNITGLTPGTDYTVTAENASGCTADSEVFTIGATLDAVDAPVVTVVDATCEMAGSASLVPVAGLTYTVSPSGAVDVDGNITGLTPGTDYTVTAENASGCTADSEVFTIGATLDAVDAPVVTVVDATCEMAGSASLVPVAGLTYTVSPSGAVDVDGNITGLTPGTDYTVTAENASGCTADSEVFTIGATLDAVDAPVVTVVDATCEMAGSASLVPVAGLTYTVSPSGAVDVDGNITGLTPGTDYTVTAENASGCTADSEVFTIGATLDAVDAPVVTVVDATCEMAGSASLVPVAGLTYTVSPSGAVDVDGNITGLTPGTDYTVTAENASGCTADSEVFTIGATLDAVDAPVVTVVDATCEMAGSASLVPVAGLTYTVSPSGAVDVDGNITGLTPGTDYTVTAENASGCTADSEVFTIGATLDAVDAPVVTVVDATCEMAGSASLVPVAGLTYTVSPSGAVDVDGNITGLTPGTDYTVTAENASGCTADSEVFTIGATLDAVDAPVVTVVDATCEMAGSASLVPVAGLTYTVSPSGAVDVDGNITGLTPGTDYTVTAENASGCTADSEVFTIGATLDAVDAPVVTVVDATCEMAGSASLVPVAGLTYTVSPSGAVDVDGNITGLTPGTDYTVTAENASGCTADSEVFTIGATLDAVDAPVVTVVDATCEMAGSASLVPVAGLTYTVSPSGAVDVDGNITGLTPGTDYTVTAENASGCTADSEVFTIGATLDAVDAPVVTVVDATCEMAGSASLVPVAGLTYTVSPSGAVDVDGNITGLTPGTDYTVTAENASGCTADSEVFTIGATLDAVDVPEITGDDTYCYDGNGVVLMQVQAMLATFGQPEKPHR